MDVVAARLVEVLAFTLPLFFVGVRLGTYDFSLATLVLVVLAAVLVYRGRFVTRRLFLAALLIGWALLTVAGRYSPLTYGPSLAAFGLVLTPVCAELPHTVEPERVLRWLLAGFLVSLAFAAWELGVNLVGLPPFERLVSVGLLGAVHTQQMLGFRRIKASMAEPAHYAIYVVAVYVIMDLASRRGLRIRGERWLKAGALVALFSTLSLSGFLLLGIYVAVRGALGLGATLRSLRSRRGALGRLLLASAGVVAAGILGVWLVQRLAPGVFDLVFGRLGRTLFVVQNAVYRGSEGSRANAIPVMLRYWSSHGLHGVLFGEGYARYESWLSSTFAYWRFSTLAQGRLANVLAVLGISTGAVGLALYLGFVTSVLADRRRRLPLTFGAVWLGAHFAYGFLIGYLLWSLLLVAEAVLARPAGSPVPGGNWRPGLLVSPPLAGDLGGR